MITCNNCGHPRRCATMDRCIMGKMPPAPEAPKEPAVKNVNTTSGNVLMKGDKVVSSVFKKKAKKKAK
jgi:hypothetical protein